MRVAVAVAWSGGAAEVAAGMGVDPMVVEWRWRWRDAAVVVKMGVDWWSTMARSTAWSRELLPKEILGAITQRDTRSYYPKRDWDVLWENGGTSLDPSWSELELHLSGEKFLRCDLNE
ncbi:hypothetical protein Tco_0936953 [Tanacetum coccineum]|uniref:Uncharacterized protein n=1 Tax=Tanacetum coccineum TaxID=301880 RepID=A0ABQ5DDS8_9ASTR